MDSEEWITDRPRFGNALLTLVDAGHELGIAAEQVAVWHTVAESLNDALMLLLTGAEGCGKSSLAGALVKGDFEPGEPSPGLVIWKYGQESINIADIDLLESYRPANGLKHLEFVEVDERARESSTGAMERAYMMSDMVAMVFSAADPWGEQQWELLGDMHRLRGQPVVVVVTHAEQRTEEELLAIVEHLCKRAQQVTGQEVAGFIFSTSHILAARKGKDEEAVMQGENVIEHLRQWLLESMSRQAETGAIRERVQSVLKGAVQSVEVGFEKAQGDCESEAECIRRVEIELEDEAAGVMAVAEQETSGMLEGFKEEILKVRERLAGKIGMLGVGRSLFQGGGWVNAERRRVAGVVAGEVEVGLRRSVARMEGYVAESRRRISERVAGVFGEGLIKGSKGFEISPSDEEYLEVVGRRAQLRIHEALEDREEASAIGAMIGWRRMVLWIILLGIAIGVERAWALSFFPWHGEGLAAVLAPSALGVALLWLLVYLRVKKRRILTLYDRVMNASRSQMERRIEEIQETRIELFRQDLPGILHLLRQRSAELAAWRRCCRERVAGAISLAQEL
ncbi:MAG: GTPase domain-containing protein [Verrucomicrobiaceae bacterium]|nr:GTPase domain-containing protein [Verrucomicrobiaceae bacterium]